MKPADDKMIVTLTIAELREIVRQEVAITMAANQPKPKLTFTTAEAATILNVPETWLAAAARDGRVPSVKIGHYVRFKLADLEQFIEQQKATA